MVRTSVDWILLNPSAATVTPLPSLPRSDHIAITIDAITTAATADADAATATAKTLSNSHAAHRTNGTHATTTTNTTTTSSSSSSNNNSSRRRRRESVFSPVIQAATATKQHLLALLSWIGDSIAALFQLGDESTNTSKHNNVIKHNDGHLDECEAGCIIQDNDDDDSLGPSLRHGHVFDHHIVLDVDVDVDSDSDSDLHLDDDEDDSTHPHTPTTAVLAQETARVVHPTSASTLPAPSTALAHVRTQDLAAVASAPAPASASAPAPREAAPPKQPTPKHDAALTATEKAKAFVAHAQAHSTTPIRLISLKLDGHLHKRHQVDSASITATATTGTGTGTCSSRVDFLRAPELSHNSLLRQYVCDCDECPSVSIITEHVALAYASSRDCELGVDIHAATTNDNKNTNETNSTSDTNDGAYDTPRTLLESLVVWRILRALAVYNETRAPRRTDVSVVTRMLRRCANVSERAFESLVSSGCFDA